MALQRIRRQTWKKQQVETSPGVSMLGRSMDQGTTHRHGHVGMGLSQKWPPSSRGLNAPGSASRCRTGSRPPPQTTPGQEKAVSWRAGSCHHNSRSWGMWVLQPVPAQSRVSSVPVAEGRSAGQAPGTAQSPSACTSLYPCPGDSLHPPKKGWEGDGGANGPAGAGW